MTPRARVIATPTRIATEVIQEGRATTVSPVRSPSHMSTTTLK